VFTKGHKHGRGGARPGSGPKKKAATLLRERLEQEKLKRAEECLEFIYSVSIDPVEKKELRVHCAESYLDRILGKPAQALKHSGEITEKRINIFMPAQVIGEGGRAG